MRRSGWGYFEVYWKVEEIKFSSMVLIQRPHQHTLIVPVRDILDHERRLSNLINVIQIDVELPRIDLVLSFLFVVVHSSTTHVTILLLPLLVVHSDIDLLVSHLLVHLSVHLAGLLHRARIAVLDWWVKDLLPHLLHSHLLLHLLDLEPMLLHLDGVYML